jgi:hypothetical protein
MMGFQKRRRRPRFRTELALQEERPHLLVEASGIENDKRRMVGTMEHQEGSIGVLGDSAGVPNRASKRPIDRRDVTESSSTYGLSNVVETALAEALVLAAEAKRWDVVTAIAEELRRRSEPPATDGEVVAKF